MAGCRKAWLADIVIIDPETVAEGSDYKAGMNGLPPKGLPHVIVNGQFVKKDNKATNILSGQPIRFPVEEKPRFIPATTEQWLKDFSLVDGGAVRPK